MAQLELLLSPSTFKWVYNETPMSSLNTWAVCEVLYFVVIFGIQWILRGKPAPSTHTSKNDTSGSAEHKKTSGSDGLFKFGLCLHNAILCLLSLAMFLGAAYESFLRSRREGYEWLFCEKPGAKAEGGVYYWSYIYYLSKYLEFGDTVFKTMGLLFNTLVHVFMYYYYALTVYYPPPWWKRFITKGQIIQFQSSFVLSIPFIYLHVTRTFIQGGEGCQGAGSFLFNAAFNLSLLFLFIRFSRRTYSTAKKSN